jgi:hypothetical protein
LFSYIITPSDKKSKPETKNVFGPAKVFLPPIRGTYKFDTYTFSLTLTAPGFDRVG